jgi:hypothetical protein
LLEPYHKNSTRTKRQQVDDNRGMVLSLQVDCPCWKIIIAVTANGSNHFSLTPKRHAFPPAPLAQWCLALRSAIGLAAEKHFPRGTIREILQMPFPTVESELAEIRTL